MKRQEICRLTGLTPKALRLYEEKGLITPSQEGSHNKVRDYSREDLRRLQIIATLRRAMFTISEIKEMLDTPEAIQAIFPQYLEWLRQQSRQIDELLRVSEQVDLSRIGSAEDLTEQIESAAKSLPIPASDIHFRFRQLDALESARPSFTTEENLDRLLPGDRTYRSAAVAISRDRLDNTLAFNSQLNDTRSMGRERSGGVADRQLKLKLWQRLIRWGLDLGIVIGLVLLVALHTSYGPQKSLLPAFAVLIPAALLRAVLAWKDHWTAQRAWLGDNADFAAEQKRITKIAAIAAGILAVLGLSSWGLIELMWTVEPPGTLSTAGMDMEEFFENMPGQVLNLPLRTMGEYEGTFPDGYAVAPDKIYFILGYLFSIDPDYTNLTRISKNILDARGAYSKGDTFSERPSNLIYLDGCIYYVSYSERHPLYGPYKLMRHRTGTKVKPETVAEGFFTAIGLGDDGTIVCYDREKGGKWNDVQRVDPNSGQ